MERQHDAATKHYQEESEARCLVKRNNDILNTQAELLLTISRTVATCATQQNTQNLQQIVLDVLSTNMKIYEIVLDMQMTMHGRLPPQIHRQQPVYFEDAHGRIAPFHIEFINFLEAFQAVMEVRFRHVPGLKKVQRNEYIIQESGSRRKLDLRAHWDSVFLPGRKVVMSMVFHTPQESSSTCPGCQTHNTSTNTESQREAQWYDNGFSRITFADLIAAAIPIAECGINEYLTLERTQLNQSRISNLGIGWEPVIITWAHEKQGFDSHSMTSLRMKMATITQ